MITAWYDRDISAGVEWANQIDQHLETAKVILLLISDDFVASDYCYDTEMKRAMERHKSQANASSMGSLHAAPMQDADCSLNLLTIIEQIDQTGGFKIRGNRRVLT